MSSQANLLLQYDYGQNLMFQAQQMPSMLEFSVMRGLTDGEKKRHHMLGTQSLVQIQERHQATPYTPNTHDDRWSVQSKWVSNDYYDKFDELRSAVSDVEGQYIRNAVHAINRKKDELILTAAGGSAVTGQTGTGTQALPSAQKVAVNLHTFDPAAGTADVGLTVYKLQKALSILEGDHGGLEGFTCHVAMPSKQKQALMSSTKVVSDLYNNGKPLTTNELATFLGCRLHVYADSLIKTDGSSDELVYVWIQEGLQMDVPSDTVETRITEDHTRNYSLQCWASLQMAAVRLDDKKVVEVACDPTPVIVG